MDDDDYLPIPALNDLLFCERRCAMHRVEQVWVENRFTLEGTSAHKKVHAGPSDEDLGAHGHVVRGLWLRSERLRLVGIADLVEFRPAACSAGVSPASDCSAGVSPAAAMKNKADSNADRPHPNPLPEGEGVKCPHPSPGHPLAGPEGEGERHSKSQIQSRRAGIKSKIETPYPVEYKRGKRRRWDNDDVQLCAQALCLEEMLGVAVHAGAVFHVKSRRRREIVFDDALRQRTEAAARRLHELFATGETPPPVLKPRCRGCSLRELCLPEMLAERSRAAAYQQALFAVEMRDEG